MTMTMTITVCGHFEETTGRGEAQALEELG